MHVKCQHGLGTQYGSHRHDMMLCGDGGAHLGQSAVGACDSWAGFPYCTPSHLSCLPEAEYFRYFRFRRAPAPWENCSSDAAVPLAKHRKQSYIFASHRYRSLVHGARDTLGVWSQTRTDSNPESVPTGFMTFLLHCATIGSPGKWLRE